MVDPEVPPVFPIRLLALEVVPDADPVEPSKPVPVELLRPVEEPSTPPLLLELPSTPPLELDPRTPPELPLVEPSAHLRSRHRRFRHPLGRGEIYPGQKAKSSVSPQSEKSV